MQEWLSGEFDFCHWSVVAWYPSEDGVWTVPGEIFRNRPHTCSEVKMWINKDSPSKSLSAETS